MKVRTGKLRIGYGNRSGRSSTGAALALAFALAGCAAQDRPATPQGEVAVTDPLQRGEYLVKTLDCNSCHTPWTMTAAGPAPDPSRFLSGHPASLEMGPFTLDTSGGWVWGGSATNTAYAGPWGISYATNLTPHETGLGVWSEEMFIGAIRTGKHMGAGRPILPPMPWPAYSQLTDDDLRAIFTYLKSVPAIENAPPASSPAPPPGS